MKHRVQSTLGWKVIALFLTLSPVWAENDPASEVPHVVKATLDVTADAARLPSVTTINEQDIDQRGLLGDGAEALRGTVGLSLGRMGGHGLEPTMRGLAQTNINVLLEGAQIHGGCPNRMDPPTSFGVLNGLDEIVVIKGLQSLRFGSGGNAGTILFTRSTPQFEPGQWWSAGLGIGYGSFLDGPELSFDAALGTPEFSMRVLTKYSPSPRTENTCRIELTSVIGVLSRPAITL